MARTNVRDAIATDKQTSSEVATVDPAAAVLDQIKEAVDAQLPQHIKPEYFLRAALTMMRGKSGAALARCDRPTLYTALLEAARHGLMPGTDEAAIVPYGKTATFIPQYQGLVKQMLNSGQISAVEAHLIHQHDKWRLAYGDAGGFFHEPFLIKSDGTATTPEERGEVVLAYCYVVLRDGTRSTVTMITKQEAIETRDNRSRSYQQAESNGKHNSAWHTDFDAMWLKTAVRRHAKWVPRSPELIELLLAASRDDLLPGADSSTTAADLGWTVDIGGVVEGEIVEGEVVVEPQCTHGGDCKVPGHPNAQHGDMPSNGSAERAASQPSPKQAQTGEQTRPARSASPAATARPQQNRDNDQLQPNQGQQAS